MKIRLKEMIYLIIFIDILIIFAVWLFFILPYKAIPDFPMEEAISIVVILILTISLTVVVLFYGLNGAIFNEKDKEEKTDFSAEVNSQIQKGEIK